ncbi:DUF3558 family protein [Parasphingorhabdus pacifica]
MSGLVRLLTFGVSGLALLAVTGCFSTSGASSDDAGQPRPALSEFEPCTVMKQKQLDALGVESEPRVIDPVDSETGCSFRGDTVTVTVLKNPTLTLAEYGQKSTIENFSARDVNGREGATAKTVGATDDMCTTMLSAGGGVVLVDAQASDPREPLDACGVSLDIAETIEPALPE